MKSKILGFATVTLLPAGMLALAEISNRSSVIRIATLGLQRSLIASFTCFVALVETIVDRMARENVTP